MPDFWSVHRFPVQGATLREWTLTPEQITAWQDVYPHVDVDLELRKALAWVQANPQHQKTARGMMRFLVNWMHRAIDRGTFVKRTTVSEPWHCPHVVHCGHRKMCQNATLLHRPERATTEAS